ncbi:MAG: HPP family protein [Bilophila wadsworthia]
MGKSSPGAVWPSPCIALLNATPRATGFPLIGLLGRCGAGLRAIRSPLAQPRNLVGGHFPSALVGVSCYSCSPARPGWPHAPPSPPPSRSCTSPKPAPPGGATALIAVTGGEGIHRRYLYARAVPARALIMLAIALS